MEIVYGTISMWESGRYCTYDCDDKDRVIGGYADNETLRQMKKTIVARKFHPDEGDGVDLQCSNPGECVIRDIVNNWKQHPEMCKKCKNIIKYPGTSGPCEHCDTGPGVQY
jgi:hypothetical protein